MFGPGKAEVWRKLSDELGGRVVEGGFCRGDAVQIDHGDWTVTLDTYVVSTGKTTMIFTRMRAPFVNTSGFRFRVYRAGVFSGLAKLFGMQDIEIDDPPFDHDFIVQATSESWLRELLANVEIRRLIAAQTSIDFGVKDDEGWFGTRFPDGVDELHFSVLGVIKDLERLKLLYDLFAETLDTLCRIGAAADIPPGVQVR